MNVGQGTVHFFVYVYKLFLTFVTSVSGFIDELVVVRNWGIIQCSFIEIIFGWGITAYVTFTFAKYLLDIIL